VVHQHDWDDPVLAADHRSAIMKPVCALITTQQTSRVPFKVSSLLAVPKLGVVGMLSGQLCQPLSGLGRGLKL
jgi:hypothetical protein